MIRLCLLRGPRAATFPRCLRLGARDPRGALDLEHMRLGWPHADRRWRPYRVLGVGLPGKHRLAAGVRSYRLGRVAATGRDQSDAWGGCIVCSTTESSSTGSAWRSSCSRRRAANASTVRAASSWGRLKHRSTTSAPAALRPVSGVQHTGEPPHRRQRSPPTRVGRRRRQAAVAARPAARTAGRRRPPGDRRRTARTSAGGGRAPWPPRR